ncbi:MAG TPA: cell division protein ZapA [Gemmatimonadaceae bacterium]|nr:cell division protein ZapA [Gemmatimonadaceae bacterium]
MTKSSVKVTIDGDEYTIRSDASPDHTRSVADYVDRAIRTVLQGSPSVDGRKAAILAALQITDELFRTRASSTELATAMSALSADIRRRLPPSKRAAVE